MSAETETSITHPRPWLQLALLIGATFLVAALGSLATVNNTDGWYADADKPWFTPPNWLFAPVWTTLYVAMAVAAWLVWRAGGTLILWWLQLVFNLAWTPTFFELQWLWGGAVVIIILDVLVALTAWQFWRHSRVASLLMLPYLTWVLYATALTIGVASLN